MNVKCDPSCWPQSGQLSQVSSMHLFACYFSDDWISVSKLIAWFPTTFAPEHSRITLLSDSEGWPAQIEQHPVWLKHHGHVCNIDSSMWLTVKAGVYPSPIIPSSPSFETWWRFSVCACVEKAARRAECQLSAHVVNIRNQTGANRMQVRLAIAFICTNKPPWHLIISHCYIGTVCNNRLSVWRDGCGWRRLNISINCGGVRINSFDNWAPWV